MRDLSAREIKKVYDFMGDDMSRSIFENRLLYSLTGDTKFIRNVVCTLEKGDEIYRFLKTCKKTIGIFGAGRDGKRLAHVYQDIPFECFIDNRRFGGEHEGLPIISLEKFQEKYPDGIIVISTVLYFREIMKQLLDAGFPKENIVNLGEEYEKLNHLQYFDLPQLSDDIASEEVFVDCGSYDGNTSLDFIHWCSRNDVRGGISMRGSRIQSIKRNAGNCLKSFV